MELWADKVGALYDGLKYKDAFINRLVPFIFMLKRIWLAAGCFYFKLEMVTSL
jgi:hypothetical protein